MKSHRMFVFLAALAAACMLSCNGCKSSTQTAANQATTTQQANSQQAGNSGAQPAPNPAPNSAQPSTPQSGPAPAQPSGAPAQPGSAQPGPAAPQAPPQPVVVDLPTGTRIRVRLDEDLGSKISQPGDSFTATVSDDVVVNGQTIIAHGSRADGTVIDAKPLGRFKGGALLDVKLTRVHTNWGSYPVETSSIDRAEKGKGKRSAGFIGGGAGLGAIIGGIAGGGKGAAIGALAGGGAGTAGTAFTDNKQIVLPAETPLTFNLEHSVHITEQK